MKYKIAEPNDLIEILHLAKDEMEEGEGSFKTWEDRQKWIIKTLYSNQYEIVVAEDGFGVVGYLIWQLSDMFGKKLAYVHFLYISKDHRGLGIGKGIATRTLKSMFEKEAEVLRYESNTIGNKFHIIDTSDVKIFKAFYIDLSSDESKAWIKNFTKE